MGESDTLLRLMLLVHEPQKLHNVIFRMIVVHLLFIIGYTKAQLNAMRT